MPYTRQVQAPDFFWDSELSPRTIQKSGCRSEIPLALDDQRVRYVTDQLSISKPLKFASLIRAFPACEESHMPFHVDSGDLDRENVLVYLRDVFTTNDGPVQFRNSGEVYGNRGTSIVFNAAQDLHRGLVNKSNSPRDILALAYSPSKENIETIGYSCGYSATSYTLNSNGTSSIVTMYLPNEAYELSRTDLSSLPVTISAYDTNFQNLLFSGYVLNNFFSSSSPTFTLPSYTSLPSISLLATFTTGSSYFLCSNVSGGNSNIEIVNNIVITEHHWQIYAVIIAIAFVVFLSIAYANSKLAQR